MTKQIRAVINRVNTQKSTGTRTVARPPARQHERPQTDSLTGSRLILAVENNVFNFALIDVLGRSSGQVGKEKKKMLFFHTNPMQTAENKGEAKNGIRFRTIRPQLRLTPVTGTRVGRSSAEWVRFFKCCRTTDGIWRRISINFAHAIL